MRFRPEHIGRQRRPFKGLWEFLLRRRVAQIFRATMAFCAKICVSLRVVRLCFAFVKVFAPNFKKRWIYRSICGNIPLKDLKANDIQSWVNDLSKRQGLSPQTVKNIFGNLQSALDVAKKQKMISENPCEDIKIGRAHV